MYTSLKRILLKGVRKDLENHQSTFKVKSPNQPSQERKD
jgi:hypothetical protein